MRPRNDPPHPQMAHQTFTPSRREVDMSIRDENGWHLEAPGSAAELSLVLILLGVWKFVDLFLWAFGL